MVTDITTTQIINDDKSKFQISPISSMLNFNEESPIINLIFVCIQFIMLSSSYKNI